ncbi:hypothetical protein ABEO98_22630 [Brevibacillus parabrevis]|uniref:hypothetical protein n=1 Tax=Brevibacillus parabrevis TaxID=54914 RepID=UPI003D1BBDAB
MDKPRVVKAKISRTVTEIATVILDRDGNIEEIQEIHEEVEWDNGDVLDIRTVLTSHP